MEGPIDLRTTRLSELHFARSFQGHPTWLHLERPNMHIGPLPPLRQKSKDCPRPHLILCPQIEGTVIVKKSDHCSCSRDLGSTATSGSPLWRVGDGRVPCGGRYHAKFQSPPYLEIRVDLFKLLFNSWPCFAIVFNLFFFFKAYPNTINYWMKHQKEMLLNGWVIVMQISCICNVYESALRGYISIKVVLRLFLMVIAIQFGIFSIYSITRCCVIGFLISNWCRASLGRFALGDI